MNPFFRLKHQHCGILSRTYWWALNYLKPSMADVTQILHFYELFKHILNRTSLEVVSNGRYRHALTKILEQLLHHRNCIVPEAVLGPVSLRLMTSQFKDIVTHTQNSKQWNAYFAVYGFKILCEISKVPFEISHKILNPYTAKYAFYDVLKIWRLTIS